MQLLIVSALLWIILTLPSANGVLSPTNSHLIAPVRFFKGGFFRMLMKVLVRWLLFKMGRGVDLVDI